MSIQLKSLSHVHLFAIIGVAMFASTVNAQGPNNSLYSRRPVQGTAPVPTLVQRSWTASPLPPPRQFRRHDIVSIRVQEGAQMFSEGEAQTRKVATFTAILLDWLRISGVDQVSPALQPNGDPTVAGSLNRQYRADGDLETRESMTFNIAATIVDVRPNGNLVLEARRQIRNNNETWEYALTGECRAQDIDPANLVLSRDIANLRLDKREVGLVRDGYRRGWFTRWFDTYQPF